MSERKSWDVQPNRRPSVPARPQPTPTRAAPAKRAAARPSARAEVKKESTTRASVQTAPRRVAPTPKGTLKERRTKQRRAARYVAIVVLILALAGAFYAVWNPMLRIHAVSAQGPSSEAAKAIASMKLEGSYWYLIPRNSVFFFPKDAIRAAILDAAPGVSAVSLTRTSFSSLEVTTTPRAASFIWCGTSIETAGGQCFNADIEGLLFKEANDVTIASTSSTTSQKAMGDVRVFSALDKEIPEGQSPLRAHVASPALIPDALRFVGAMRGLGAPVSILAIRGDEADLWMPGPTRITYVLGHEKEAAELAASALPTLTLTNGSIQYVDLRFAGKAYVKRNGQ